MKNVKRPVFLYPRAAMRPRRSIHCRGQTLVEYALIIAVVSIVAIGVLVNLQHSVGSIYTSINNQLILSAAATH